MAFFNSMNEDLLHNILSRLPAKPFAFASCMNQSWNSVCNRILSRPKLISAFSRNPVQIRAGEEVLDKILSEPIRPHFVIANITSGDMDETLTMITNKVGSKVPIIVSRVAGVLGKEACNDKAGEVKKLDSTDEDMPINENLALLLTIGYFPGMKVDVIPVIQSKVQSEETIGDKFVMDIRNYVSEVSDHTAPACVILFGEDTHATEPIIRKLDYAMPAETIVVGDQNGGFIYKSGDESRNIELQNGDCRILAGLIFARDKLRPSQAERIEFQTAISRGMSPIDLRYTAVDVNASPPGWTATYLTAKRIGEAEVRNGEQIQSDIDETLLGGDDIYIGVTKRRKYSVGLEKSKIMSSLVFHEVEGVAYFVNDGQYLSVCGSGIKTGEFFQVYRSDVKKAEASLAAVSSQLSNLNVCSREKKIEVVGGFIFAAKGRGDSFFGRPNADSSPLLENFPELQFGGIFCCGQVGRSLSVKEEEEEEEERSIQKCLHLQTYQKEVEQLTIFKGTSVLEKKVPKILLD